MPAPPFDDSIVTRHSRCRIYLYKNLGWEWNCLNATPRLMTVIVYSLQASLRLFGAFRDDAERGGRKHGRRLTPPRSHHFSLLAKDLRGCFRLREPRAVLESRDFGLFPNNWPR